MDATDSRLHDRRPRPRALRAAAFAGLLALLVVYAEPVADATRGLIALPSLVRRAAPPVQWEGVVPAGGTLEVQGVHGAIVASRASGPEAQVTAWRTGRRDDPGAVEIVERRHAAGVTICAIYPLDASEPAACRPGADPDRPSLREDVRVTFHVRVPPGVRFVARTVDGDLTADDLDGPVALSTINGAAAFSTSSYGEARTVNGSIRASIGTTDWRDALTLATVNGSITVDLPPHAAADVQARARYGEATTEFAPGPTAPRRRTLDLRLGPGGRALRMETVNGSIRLRRR